MAVKVREGIDYRILDDDYREIFRGSYRPYKVLNDGTKLYKCVYCGEVVALGKEYNGNAPLEVDHIIPKTRMGAGILWNPNKSWNLAPSCKACNVSKSNYIDMRVIRGFNNKLKQKYLLGVGQNNSGVEQETPKWLTGALTILITLITVVSPLLIVGSFILQGVWSFIRRIFMLVLKMLRKEAKAAVKTGKNILVSILVKVVSLVFAIYMLIVLVNFIKTGSLDLVSPALTTVNVLNKLLVNDATKNGLELVIALVHQ